MCICSGAVALDSDFREGGTFAFRLKLVFSEISYCTFNYLTFTYLFHCPKILYDHLFFYICIIYILISTGQNWCMCIYTHVCVCV